ncbi:serine/arginine repetitive matrix protein 2-like, partial [Amphibalanus amphitrite]|uniref:serine/arginine repetitive matrix protein 2-like n=1 Tax=Amphibalanus amphitrite TaxID=1232801 RepID=UPI001C91A840
ERPTDTTSSDYEFSTIRSRQRRLEDATASSFEYYDPGPRRRRSSPDEGASAPEAAARLTARSVTPPSPAPGSVPGPDCDEADHSDLLHLLRHTTDNVIRSSRETRTRRTPVPPSTSSDAAAAETRHRPRSRTTRGGQRHCRSTSGEASRRLGSLVGEHRQKHVQQLQHEITKLGRLERMLLGGTTVELDDCSWSEDGSAAGARAGRRRGVEGRSSPSDDSDDPPEPSSAYARIRETLQRRRRQIEAQLNDMDRRHQQYSRRLERFSDLPEEAGAATASDSESGPVSRRADTRSSGQRRVASTVTESRRRAVSSQETTTQTTTQTSSRTSSRRRSDRASQCELSPTGGSVQVVTRRSRVLGSDVSTQTTSGGPTDAVQVFTRRTRVSAPSDSATQTTSTAPRRTVTVTRRQVPGSPRRAHRAVQTSRSPERTVTVTRRRAAPEQEQERRPRSAAVQTVTRRRKVPSRRPESAAPEPCSSRREVVVRRRPVADGGSADTETISTAADTTADTTPTTARSSATYGEGMRDALEPSERAGDLERAEQLLGTPDDASGEQAVTVSEGSSGDSASSGGGAARSPDADRAQCLLREGLRVDELDRALWRADFCQEPPECPASPRRRWAGSSEESRSVGTQTGLLAARAAGPDTFRCETVRREVHSEDSEIIHHPPRPPTARRSVAYFLSVRRGPLRLPPAEEPGCRRVLPAVRLSQELLRQQGLAGSGTDSATGTECVREEDAMCSEDGRRVSVTQRRPAGPVSAAECLTLQEALCRRRPDYIRNASVRRQYLQRLAELRRCNLERAARAAQTLPQVPTDADWCHFADALRPESVRRAFDYRDMRQHTERLWRRLPEIRDCVAKRKKHAQFRTNRLMWQVYRQKLQERCLRGDVHLTHRDAVLSGV